MGFKLALTSLSLVFFSLNLFANEEEFILPKASSITPTQSYAKTLSVLNHFNVPPDLNAPSFLQDLSGGQSSVNINILLPYFGGVNETNGFFNLSDSKFQGFKDFQAKQVLDFSINLKSTEDTTANQNTFHERLIQAQRNFSTQKLKGLRIALDPGHMGTPEWDEITGKYVQNKDGRRLSEGLLVLEASLLLEQKLKALGAEVLITHRVPGPVSPTPVENINLKYYAGQELKRNILSDWFQKLLATPGSQQKLFAAFENSPELQSLYSENARDHYFILREDLHARADMINAFKPDIVLVIHMDAGGSNDGNGINPEKYDKVKTFVEGNLAPVEWSSPTDRTMLARQLLNAHSWNASVDLSRSVIQSMTAGMALEPEIYNENNSQPIEAGISTRNLYLTRTITDTALSYVECLYYDDADEFNRLADYKYKMIIDGKSYPYSERLVQLSDSLLNGVTGFVEHYNLQ
ncbi:MAG: N-acetylmuramoyl-L-alanine amidase [Pseudobdellovibrio sp.]